MKSVMLDTNTASYIVKPGYPNVLYWLERTSRTQKITMSAVTRGELIYGLALKSFPKVLTAAVNDLLHQVSVLPWDASVSDTYGKARAWFRQQGMTLAALDMMIAAHAIAENATLITSDTSFEPLTSPALKHCPFRLLVRNWMEPPFENT
ncbi:Ribonuclease VapC [Candidatus Nitrospira nitrificans]|uniref:Ribonuclease VapC n=1 Tax=Candidatus Nitrospira nitrificans TaxID=1742973 RepID=A0A0S4LHT9_9BACT|nr:Ribonuclease VapC [Candidatus Nitrospira nitrificans]